MTVRLLPLEMLTISLARTVSGYDTLVNDTSILRLPIGIRWKDLGRSNHARASIPIVS